MGMPEHPFKAWIKLEIAKCDAERERANLTIERIVTRRNTLRDAEDSFDEKTERTAK